MQQPDSGDQSLSCFSSVSSDRCGPSALYGPSRRAREERCGQPPGVALCPPAGLPRGLGALSQVLNFPALPGERRNT